MFPGDTSEEQRNLASSAASIRPHQRTAASESAHTDEESLHILESSLYLMRMCLMALGGHALQFPSGGSISQNQPKAKLFLHQNNTEKTNFPLRSSGSEIATFSLPPISADRSNRHAGNDKPHISKDSVSERPTTQYTSPIARPAGALIGSSCKSESKDACSVSVRCIYFTRVEEVELLWLETCKIFADLGGSTTVTVADRALFCLETVLLAGTKCEFPSPLPLKAMGELAVRLPLNFSAVVSRLRAAHPQSGGQMSAQLLADAASICQRSCNLLFDLVVQHIKQMRDTDEFLPIWTRFISVLATNAQAAAPRGLQWWHDEMCDALEALLRLLRLPSVAVAPPAPTKQAVAGENENNANHGNDKSGPIVAASGGGFFSWFVAPLIAATDGPDVTGQALSNTPSTTISEASLDMAAIEPSDGFLLRLSWSHICSAFPMFPGSLRLRDPPLHARITRALQLPEIYFRKNVSVSPQEECTAIQQKPDPSDTTSDSASPITQLKESDSGSVELSLNIESTTSPVIGFLPPIAEMASPPAVAASGPIALQEYRPHSYHSHPAIDAEHSPSPEQIALERCPDLSPIIQQAVTPAEFDTVSLTSADSSMYTHTTLQATPVKAHEAFFDTPLANEKSPFSYPTPVETPPQESSATPHTESAAKRAMPFVKNLTPIFASAGAEHHRYEEDRSDQPSSASRDDTGDLSVVRKLELGPVASADTPVTQVTTTTSSLPLLAPSAVLPSSPWQTYPTNTPPVSAQKTVVPMRLATVTKTAVKGTSRIQIV